MQPYHTNPSAFRAPTAHAPFYPFSHADQCLQRAIKYANKHDISSMIEEALKAGATLNYPNSYDFNALVIAVRANNHHAISPLMARGAALPIPLAHGTNLLMEACADGHLDMAIQLIDVAKIDIHAKDRDGKTALHYALLGGFEDVATLLLGHGADPNAEAKNLSRDEAHRIFGINVELSDKSITPLMIAVGKRNEDLTTLLLDAGATPNLGSYSPLLIAACADQQSIFDALLARNADLLECKDLRGNEGMDAFIAGKVPVSYLSKIVDQHDFSADDGSIYSPLGLAVERNMYDACALFLHCEAPIEDQDQTEERHTIWMEALSGGLFSSPMATLLTAARPEKIDIASTADFAIQLICIVDNIHKPESLASMGFFTSLLLGAEEELKQLQATSGLLTPQQKAMAAASIIRQCVPPPGINQFAWNDEGMAGHQVWRRKTESEKELQRISLSKACNHFIDYCGQKLKEATTLEFMEACANQCTDLANMREFIATRIAEESGMPEFIVSIVSTAWDKAAALRQSWEITEDDSENNRHLQILMHNWLRAAADKPGFDTTKLEFECIKALDRALPRESLPLHQFCINPVTWLRKFEQRKSLADPADHLADQLQTQLGLPYATCEAITGAWQQAIHSARQARWNTPQELQHALETQLAINLNGIFPGEHGKEFVSAFGNDQFVRWSTKYLFNSSTSSASRKRPAEAEAPDTPQAKIARNSSPDTSESSQSDD